MKQVPIKLGPLALLLAVISICLTTLAILTFTTAQADQRLSDRFADTVSARYQLDAKGQEFLSELSAKVREQGAAAAEGFASEDGEYVHEITQDVDTLTIHFDISDGTVEVLQYRFTRDWEEDPGLNFWDGK